MSQPSVRKRRWRFSTAGLLIAIAVISLILSRFYPRVRESVQVQVGGSGPLVAASEVLATHEQLIRSRRILSGAVGRNPRCREIAAGDPVSWLAAQIRTKPVGDNVVEISMSGFPKDRLAIRKAVDAVTAEYLDFLGASCRESVEEALAALRKASDQLKADNPSNTELLNEVAQRITKLECELKDNDNPRAKVIKRESGWGR